MSPTHPQSLIFLVLLPLIAWRMVRRFRRLVGRQLSVAWRHRTAAVLFPVLVLALGASAVAAPDAMPALGALGAGLAVGIGLAVYGLRLTRYEVTDQGLYYTPSAHIGIALSVLLAGRIGFRMFQAYEDAQAPSALHHYTNSPLTLLVFGMLAGYYATYAIGLLRWRRSVGAAGGVS